nr:MAG TPA: hypothetical protein [Inoviridae sp.]
MLPNSPGLFIALFGCVLSIPPRDWNVKGV